MIALEGQPSDAVPRILATGTSDIGLAFVSLSAREPAGRDAEYLEWHSLDHRPEQYRLAGLRSSLRLVSAPDCRAARAASEPPFDRVDHVMIYLFDGEAAIGGFSELGAALDAVGRMPLRLPSVGYMTATFAGKRAAPRAVAGADVLPWRPVTGAYLIVEEGAPAPVDVLDVPGVAGQWWFDGTAGAGGFDADSNGQRMTLCYLDGDPIAAAAAISPLLHARWQAGTARGLLASPFYAPVPFAWDRYLP